MTNRRTRRELELAGLASDSGKLDRPLLVGLLQRPKSVELDDNGNLVWAFPSPRTMATPAGRAKYLVPPGDDLLADFLDLANGTRIEVRKFASQWGLLLICAEHGLPACHSSPYEVGVHRIPECRPKGWATEKDGTIGGTEHVEDWTGFAQQAQAFLNSVARLNQGELGDEADWAKVFPVRVETVDAKFLRRDASSHWWRDYVKTSDLQWKLVERALNQWLRNGDIRPLVSRTAPGEDSALRLDLCGELYGTLALKLMQAAAGASSMFICVGCFKAVLSKRKPRADRGNYCGRCQKARKAGYLATSRYRKAKAHLG